MDPRRLGHRAARAAAATVLLALLCPPVSLRGVAAEAPVGARRPRLYVFLHTNAKSTALEEILRARLPALEVTVFGRYSDLDEAFRRRPPDAVLARPMLLNARSIRPVLQGVRGDSDREPYVLVSNRNPVEGSLAGRAIGVVDLLGRVSTEGYFAKVLGTSEVNLKRVIKRGDLLPLLQFGMADAALVPAVAVKHLKDQTTMDLRTRVLNDIQVGLPAVGIIADTTRDAIIRQFELLDSETNRLLEVGRWRVQP